MSEDFQAALRLESQDVPSDVEAFIRESVEDAYDWEVC